jgi:chromosome segregation ATPase
MVNDQSGNITPVSLLIEAQRQLAGELVEQRRVNGALNEALYKLSAEIKLLSNQIGRHDQIESKVAELSREIHSLRGDFKADIHSALESRTEPKIEALDERVKTLEKNMYRFAGAVMLFTFLVGAYRTFFPLPGAGG